MSWPQWCRRREAQWLGAAALLALALYISLGPARIPGKTSAIWLASGLQVGFLLRLPRSQWPASLAVFFVVTQLSIAFGGAQRIVLTLSAPILNTLAVFVTAWWLSRDADWVAGRSERLASWLRFTLIGGLLMPALWGLIGAVVLLAAFPAPWTLAGFAEAALGRFINNALGIFLLVPMMLRVQHLRRLRDPARLVEAVLALGAFTAFVTAVMLQRSVLPLFIVTLPVVVMLFRLEYFGTMASMVILSTAAIGATIAGTGPFLPMAGGNWTQAMLLAQSYLMVVFATIVLMTGLLAERHAMAQRSVELALEATRMKSDFLARMSHEIRTPLNAIIGFGELMRSDPTLSAANQQHLRIVNQSGNHLLALIDEVLDMAKIEAGRLELQTKDIHLPAFLDTVIAMMSVRAERKGLALRLDHGEALPSFIHADEVKLRQVLLNLVGNAIKFTRRGTVTLDVRHAQGELSVTVQDSGPGIAPAELKGLFVAFQQGRAGRDTAGGTGLGLAISKHFVEHMGGRLWATSTLGEGSRFAFTIQAPVAASATPTSIPREAIGLAPGQAAPRVMVVDDVEANRVLMERLMGRLGIPVVCVDNGQQAVDLFAGLQPELIWMDLVMPVMCGDVAAQRIRTLAGGREVKIVCLTASAFNGERDVRIDSGFDDVLVKPVREWRLIEAMHGLLGTRFIYREDLASSDAVTGRDGLAGALDDVLRFAEAPPTWQQGFADAVISGDMQRLQAQIDALPSAHAAFGRRLQSLFDALDLEALAACCGAIDAAPADPRIEPLATPAAAHRVPAA